MYITEGELKVSPSPESFIGQHGFFNETVTVSHDRTGVTTQTNTIWTTGSKRFVDLAANRARRNGDIPNDMAVEEITTAEQAMKYAVPSTRPIEVVRFRAPDIQELLESQVKDDEMLHAGQARLWKERQLPVPYAYLYGIGRLITEVEYVPEAGWAETPGQVDGRKRFVGLSVGPLSIGASMKTVYRYKPR